MTPLQKAWTRVDKIFDEEERLKKNLITAKIRTFLGYFFPWLNK